MKTLRDYLKESEYVSLDDSTDKYWNKQGKYSKEYEKLHDKLVPGMGKADTIEGEVLRAASKIYYRHFNDGDSFTQASFDQLKPFIGPVSSYDDLAEKAVLFALNAKGNYRPNEHWDSLERMDYGSEYEDDAEWNEDDEGEELNEKFIHPDHQKELDDPNTPADRKAYLNKLINSPRDDEQDKDDHEAWREKRAAALKGRHYHEISEELDDEEHQILDRLKANFDEDEGYIEAVAHDAVDYLQKKGLLKDFTKSLPYFDMETESVEEGMFGPADYKGWTYDSEVEEYDDNRKLFHYAVKDGKQVDMDWSPYNKPTDDEFKLWIDLGMPTRKDVGSIGPLDKDDLMTLAKTKQGTHDLLKRELDEIRRLSGLPINEDKADVMGKLDTKTRIQLQKAKQKYQALAKGDPLASMLMDLEREVDRLDQENDIEDAQIAAQDVVDKMHTDAIAKLKKKTTHEAFQYHLDNNIPIRENIFRPGSDKYFELFNYARKQFQEGKFTPDWEDQELLETDIGRVVTLNNGYKVPLDQPFADDDLSEAEYQGKKVELNKPKRGGPKKFYVYVKNPKTGKVKKVTWGDTSGLSVKASKPGRVASFVARHNCKQKNDKTKAGYWACRTPRYKSLGVKGGQWW